MSLPKIVSRLCVSALVVGVSITSAFADMVQFTKLLDQLSAYRERPLFSSTRRPFDQPKTPELNTAPVAVEPLNAVLLGVISSADGGGLAILKIDGQAEVTRIHVGEAIQGWQLDRLEPHAAVFSNADQSLTLTFPQAGSNASPVAPNESQSVPENAPVAPLMPNGVLNPK